MNTKILNLVNEFKQLDEAIYKNECYNHKDLLRLNKITEELEKEHIKYNQNVKNYENEGEEDFLMWIEKMKGGLKE